MTSIQNTDERRHFQRILFDAEVDIQLDGQYYHTNLLDVSLNGVLVKRPANWPEQTSGRECTLTIKLDEDRTAVYMQANVAHTETNSIGFRCNQIDMDSITLLRNLVEYNLDDPTLLEREFEALG